MCSIQCFRPHSGVDSYSAEVISDTEALDVQEVIQGHEVNGYRARVYYVDPVQWRIPNSRERQITIAFNVSMAMELFKMKKPEAIKFLDGVLAMISQLLETLKEAFSVMAMIPPSSFMFEPSHPEINKAMGSLESKARRMDTGVDWKKPGNYNGHPKFFDQYNLQYNFMDTQAVEIPFEARTSRSYRWMTLREKSCTGAICTLLSQNKRDQGEYTFDPSSECEEST
jgi:hypothetical protein